MSDIVVSIENLSCRFSPNGRKVLEDVSLTVREGEFVILTGPSGSGKTTLVSCIKGIVPQLVGGIVEGDIQVCGLDPRTESPATLAERVGMVFQDPESQLCNLYIRDELSFGLENLRYPAPVIEERVETAFRFLGLSATDQRLVYEASGGQKQRIAIGAVLTMEPGILVLDDPTANLDPKSATEVYTAIKDLHDQGRTIILIAHYLDDALSYADRLVVLNGGRKIIDDTPDRALQQYGLDLSASYGVRIPQVTDLALRLADVVAWERIPLSAEQFYTGGLEKLGSIVRQAAVVQSQSDGASRTDRPLVEGKNVSFAYPNGLKAVRGVTFRLNTGERLAIAGNNGSGKTTLAKLMLGLLVPTGGALTTCGMEVAKVRTASITLKVGYVFQYPEHQFIKENVFDEVAYGMRVAGLDEATVKQRTTEMLAAFGLSGLENRHPLTLSSGEKRRLSVITMLVVKPEMLILDEPTFGQDPANATRLMDLVFADIKADVNMTPVVITHDMEIIAQYCDRVLVMSNAQVMYDGTPADLFLRRPEVLAASALRPVFVAELANRLADQGCSLPGNIITNVQFVKWMSSIAGAKAVGGVRTL